MNPVELISAATIDASKVTELNRLQLLERLRLYTFARITGIIREEEVRDALGRLKATFSMTADAATTGENVEAVYGNFQKLSIGAARHGGVDRPRFMRTIYNPMWAPDIYGLRSVFKRAAMIRNLLSGVDLEFAIDQPDSGMWTAARMHHFPAGGGFMVGHRDTVLPGMYKQQGLDSYFQLLLLMSRKGVDFETGGGFIELNGQRIIYEDYCSPGDIVIYDGATEHGVEDIDVHKPFRQDSLEGRFSGLVTLFKDIRPRRDSE